MTGKVNLPVVGGSKKLWISRGVVVGALVFGLYGVLPIVWSALLAGLGLIGIGIVGVLGVGIVKLLPFLGQVWENRILKLRKSEARANPLEQLQNRLIERSGEVLTFENALRAISGQIIGLNRMIDERSRQDPNHDLKRERVSLDAMKRFHEKQVAKLRDAKQALVDFKTEIDRKKFELDFATVGNAALKSLSAAEGGDVSQRLLTQEAFQSIENQFDQVFGDLEIEASLEQARKLGFTGSEAEAQALETPDNQRGDA